MGGINEIGFCFDWMVFYVSGDKMVGDMGIMDSVMGGLNVSGKVLSDKGIKKSWEEKLVKMGRMKRWR